MTTENIKLGDDNRLVVLRKAEPVQLFKIDFSELDKNLTKEEIEERNKVDLGRTWVNFDDLLK